MEGLANWTSSQSDSPGSSRGIDRIHKHDIHNHTRNFCDSSRLRMNIRAEV